MMTEGIVYTQLVQVCTTLDQAVFALINGSVVFAFPGEGRMISYFAATEEKRALSPRRTSPPSKGPGTPSWSPCAPTPPWSAGGCGPRS